MVLTSLVSGPLRTTGAQLSFTETISNWELGLGQCMDPYLIAHFPVKSYHIWPGAKTGQLNQNFEVWHSFLLKKKKSFFLMRKAPVCFLWLCHNPAVSNASLCHTLEQTQAQLWRELPHMACEFRPVSHSCQIPSSPPSTLILLDLSPASSSDTFLFSAPSIFPSGSLATSPAARVPPPGELYLSQYPFVNSFSQYIPRLPH